MPIKPKAGTVAAFQILKAGNTNPFINMLVYGPSKAGKTQLVASACQVPQMSPVLHIDCGTSTDTILGEPRFADVDVIRINSMQQLQDIVVWLGDPAMIDNGLGNIANYGTVIVDELDQLHVHAMRGIMQQLVREKPDRKEDLPSQQEWGIVRTQMLKAIDIMLALPVHILMTSLAEQNKDELDQRVYITPGLPGKLAQDVAARMSVLAYLNVDVPKPKKLGEPVSDVSLRIAHFEPTRKYMAGVRGETRAANFGDIVDPTMTKVYNAMFGV